LTIAKKMMACTFYENAMQVFITIAGKNITRGIAK
jgi:hypothetical protein